LVFLIAAVMVLFVAVEPWLPVSRWRRCVVFGVVVAASLAGLRVLLGALDFGDGRLWTLLPAAMGEVVVGAALTPLLMGWWWRRLDRSWSEVIQFPVFLICVFGLMALSWPGAGGLSGSGWLFVASGVVLVVLSVLAWRVHAGVVAGGGGVGWVLILVLAGLGIVEAVMLINATL